MLPAYAAALPAPWHVLLASMDRLLGLCRAPCVLPPRRRAPCVPCAPPPQMAMPSWAGLGMGALPELMLPDQDGWPEQRALAHLL